MNRGAWQAAVHRVAQSQHDWSNLARTRIPMGFHHHKLHSIFPPRDPKRCYVLCPPKFVCEALIPKRWHLETGPLRGNKFYVRSQVLSPNDGIRALVRVGSDPRSHLPTPRCNVRMSTRQPPAEQDEGLHRTPNMLARVSWTSQPPEFEE